MTQSRAIAETVSILGHTFYRHPPYKRVTATPARRLRGILEAMEFASSQLTPADRALWLPLCRLEAQVRNLLADATAGERVVGEGPTWLSEAEGL